MANFTKTPNRSVTRGLSKSRVMAHRQCAKRLWLQTYRGDLADETGAQAAFDFGDQIGDVARQQYPDGHLIEHGDLTEDLTATRACLSARPRKPLFEATFAYRNTLVRADLLLPMRTGYRLVEVKASTSVKPHYLEDVAIQAWVMKNANVRVRRLELAHVDNSFIYPGNADYSDLLRYVDVASEVGPLVDKVGGWVKAARATLGGTEPRIEPGAQCKKPYPCPFIDYCSPPVEDGYPLSELQYGGKVVEALVADGYTDLRKVPAKRLSKAQHLMVHRAVKTGKPVIDPAAGEFLQRLDWPRRYLDFETIQFAVPIWKGTRPYQQIPFQWSCHRETRRGKVVHHEFLATGTEDPRRAFVESLMEALGGTGPIFVYNASFERARMEELAASFPEFAPALEAAIARFEDLLPLVRSHYYHRDQHGSWSLKAVLPTIASDLAYSELEVSNGGDASETFRSLLDPDMPTPEAESLRKALLVYCGRDTEALVRIARLLQTVDASSQ